MTIIFTKKGSVKYSNVKKNMLNTPSRHKKCQKRAYPTLSFKKLVYNKTTNILNSFKQILIVFLIDYSKIHN